MWHVLPHVQEVDIKKQQSTTPFAFLQFSDIESVVKAMRAMDGEHLGGCVVRILSVCNHVILSSVFVCMYVCVCVCVCVCV